MSWGAVAGAAVSVVGGTLMSKGARGRASSLDKKAVEMADNMNARAKDFQQQALDQWNFYKSYGQPLDIMAINETMQRVQQGPEAAVARASADVNTAYDRAGAIQTRQMQRYGDPTSGGAMADLNARTELDRARAEVGARNLSRRQEQDDIWRQLMQTSQIGQNALGHNARMGAIETDMRGGALAGYTGGAQRAAGDAAGIGGMVGDLASKIPWQGIIDKLFSPSGAPSGQGVQAGNPPSSPQSEFYREPPGYAQGGAVRPAIPTGRPPAGGPPPMPVAGRQVAGPGTGTSDSIPAVVDGQSQAALSTGEFVIPADVVRRKGTEFFEKLIAQAQPQGAV